MPQPCEPWITGDDVADCCNIETSSGFEYEQAALAASQILFEISGRLFPGECSKTVRPACDECFCGYQVLSRGHVIGPWDWGYPGWGQFCDYCLVACNPSRIKLSGYPVREITEILIDGGVLAPSEYRIWKSRYVTRLNDARWPIQQDLTLADTEDNTFSITYSYGADPPEIGLMAAAQLGCELAKACPGSGGDCALPTGVTRITRQGITIDRLAFTSWAYQNGKWQTGLTLVDAFLGAYNRSGLMRRPVFWSPGRRQYASEWG